MKNSSAKRWRQSQKKRLNNKRVKSSINTAMKKAISTTEVRKEAIYNAIKIVAKAVTKGVIHKRNAAHKISKLMNFNKKCDT